MPQDLVTTKSKTLVHDVSLSHMMWCLKKANPAVHWRVWGSSRYLYSTTSFPPMSTIHSPMFQPKFPLPLMITKPLFLSINQLSLSVKITQISPILPSNHVDPFEQFIPLMQDCSQQNIDNVKYWGKVKDRSGRLTRNTHKPLMPLNGHPPIMQTLHAY